MSTLDFVFTVNLENWTYYFSHALLPNSYLFDTKSAKILLEEFYMLEQVTTLEENIFMFRLDVKDDVNVNSKASFKRFI